MPFYVLPLGEPVQLVQNQVYALPARATYISFDTALEGAFTSAGPWVAVPGAPGPGANAASIPFIRCPTANAWVSVRRFV